jgi:uncharacterized protein YukE
MAELAAPQRFVVHKPSGDPDAARRLASAYDALAGELDGELRHAVAILDGLASAWQGLGAGAGREPQEVLAGDVSRVCHALTRSADDLRHYAHQLERAHEHHGWSLGRLVTLGAIVTVGVTAVVVTVGAAAPAEAAAAAAAVESAEAATAAAATASSTAAGGLASWQTLLAGVRPLAPFVVPHFVSAGTSVGIDGVSELIGAHRLDLHSLEVAAAVGFAGSATGGAVEGALASSSGLVRRLAEAGTWTAHGTAGQYADDGEIDPLRSAASGMTGFVARDVRFAADEARLMWKLRVPQRPLGFRSGYEWRRFVTTLYAGLDRAGYRDAVVVFRGSSVTGVSYRGGLPFDVGRISDWDLAVVDATALQRAVARGLRPAGGGTRTAPLRDLSHYASVGVDDLTRELVGLGRRPVQWMIYRDLDAVAGRGQPYVVVPRP